MDTIFSLIRQRRNTYQTGDIEVVEGYRYSQRKVVEKATKYWASQYETSSPDPILGELPFDNVVIEPVEKEAEATDFDMADIEVRPKKNTREARFKTMVATKALRENLERENFARTLNQIGITRAIYGGVLVKKTNEGTKVVPWANVITDHSNILAGDIIERHYYTPSEMKKMKGWKNVDGAIATAQSKRAVSNTGGAENDTNGSLIEVFEFHGVVPESMIKEEGGEFVYKQYMYVVSGIDWQKTDANGAVTEEGIVLYEGEEKESPYKYNARNAIEGRGLGVGVVESLFNQQRVHNFTLTEELRAMAIAGKVFFDSDNPDIPSNLLTKLDHGTVLKRKSEQSPITQVNTVPTGTPTYNAIRAEIANSKRSITGAYESMTGEEGKSNKPFKLAALQNVEGHSRYEQEREELGIMIKEIIRDWELPRAIKWITSEGELYTHFEAQELAEIDEVIKTRAINDRKVESIRSGVPVTPEMEQMWMMEADRELRKAGTKRLVTDIKDWLEDLDGDVRVATTAEGMNKQAWFDSRSSIIQLLPPEDPRRNALINRIMDEAGITPDELRLEEDKAMQAQMQAQAGANPKVSIDANERKAPALMV